MTAMTTLEAPSAAPFLARPPAHGLQVRPAPVRVPPFDDEPGPRPLLRLVTTPPLPPAPTPLDDLAALPEGRTATVSLPPARAAAVAVLRGLLESLAGVRSVKQLQPQTTPELYAVLAPAISFARERGGRPELRPAARAIRSVHLQTRPEGVVEVCATVERGGRLAALALRLEGFEGRWLVTDLAGL